MDGTLVDWLTAPEKVNLRSRIFAPPPSLARGLVQFCGRRHQRCPRPRRRRRHGYRKFTSVSRRR